VAGKCMFFLRTLFQHCFICRPSYSIVTGMLEKKVATSALSVRRSNRSARSHSQRWMLTIIGRSTSYLFYGAGIYTLIPGWLVSPDQSEIRCSDFLYIPNLTHSIKAYTHRAPWKYLYQPVPTDKKCKTDIHK
jgi:hypothetical protein